MKIKAFLALLLSLCMFLPVLAQTLPAPPPPPQKPADKQKPGDDQDDVVRITTNLVQVDAVVTKDGKPVTDLTADDFEIYEDGRKQTITSFAYISNVPSAPAPQPVPVDKNKPLGPPNPRVTPNEPRRIVAFVVDDLGLSGESMGQVRKQLKKFITEQQQPNDLVAIIRTGGELGVLQQFTNDKRLLMRAMERLRWNGCSRVGMSVFTPVGSEDPTAPYRCGNTYNQTFRALRFILDGMGELPGRKSLVLMSDDMPRETQELRLGGDGPLQRESLSGRSNSGDLGREFDQFGNTIDMSGLLQRIAEKAIRASVVIYSVDTQGLQVLGPTAADNLRGDSRMITHTINDLIASRSRQLWQRREGGDLIARQTGGYQIRNSNSFKIEQIMTDQSGYYLLGYRPGEETFNRRFHHIKAKVKRSGMTLRTRYGFFGVSEEEANRGKRTARDLTNLALASPFAAQDINIDISPFFANDKINGSVVRSFVYLEAKDMTFTPGPEGRQQAAFDLHGVIFGDNGSVVEQRTRGATVSLSQRDYEMAMRNGMQLTFDIPVRKPGAYQVRIAARDRASSKIGSAGQFVVVPNLGDKKLAVSGVILGTGSDAASHDLASPGARRFTPNSEVHFAFMIYNGTNESGALRNLVMQARLMRDDKDVFTGPEVPIRAGANQTDLSRVITSGSLRLPPDLEPGNYYLQVAVAEVGGKKKVVPVVQWADFEIEK
ncbi:MAG TPA: VWA domain-containing protein [Pyrinomonadaceae bacterium]|nr:VWA domain-containing protein [Pyrinomonadaceae bacterium]